MESTMNRRRPSWPAAVLAAALVATAFSAGCDSVNGSAELYINEFMADNETVIPDEHGQYSDWIELYNAGEDAVALDGYFLTDSLKAQTQWPLPGTLEIEGGGFLVFWASGDDTLGELHLPFKLSKAGEEIGLYVVEEGAPLQVDAVSFSDQSADVASARETDGGGTWITTSSPTPGASNG